MNPPSAPPARVTGTPPRRRIMIIAGILALSAVLQVALAVPNAAALRTLNWVVIGLTPLAAVALWLVARSRPLDQRIARVAVVVLALRVLAALALQLAYAGLTGMTFVFNVGLPAFFLYYLVAAIREIEREPAA